jgi:hypothetical protein
LNSNDNEAEVFKVYIATRVHTMYSVSAKYKLLKEELFTLLPQIEMARSPYHEEEIILLSNLLNKGIQRGVIRKADSELLAKVIVNTLKGLEIPMFVKNEFKSNAMEIDEMVNIFLNGISKKAQL